MRVGLLGSLGALALIACAGIAGIQAPDPDAGAPPAQQVGTGQQTTLEGVNVTPQAVAIPDTACGLEQKGQQLVLENTKETEVRYDLSLPDGTPFSLEAKDNPNARIVSGSLGPKQSVTFPIVVDTNKPGQYATDIEVSTSGVNSDKAVLVNVKANVTGGALSYGTDTVDFGEVQQNTVAPPVDVRLTNTGNEAIAIPGWIADSKTSPLTITTNAITIDPGATVTIQANFSAPGAQAQIVNGFKPDPEKFLCGGPPKLTIKGTPVNLDVTVTPGTVNFGDIDCFSAVGGSGTVTLQNFSTKPGNFTASLASGSQFRVNGTTSVTGNFASQQILQFAITSGSVDAAFGPRSDVLTVQTGGAGLTPHTSQVSIGLNVVGAFLTFNTTDLSNVTAGGRSFDITNAGNRFIHLSHGLQGGDANSFSVSGESRINPGTAAHPAVFLTAMPKGSYNSTVVTNVTPGGFFDPTNGKLCNPPLPSVGVHGTKN